MANIKWTLFSTEINEEIERYGKTDNRYEDDFVVSDIVSEVFYTNMFKKINVDNQEFENKEKSLKRLNELDNRLNIFMQYGKDILYSLNEEYTRVPVEDNQRLQDVILNYSNTVYDSIRERRSNLERIQSLERVIMEEFPVGEEIEVRFIEIRELMLEYLDPDSDSIPRRLLQRLYSKIRRIPLYLGSPYEERYRLYDKLQKYPKLYNTGHVVQQSYQIGMPRIVNTLMFGSSFDEYYEIKYQAILDYIKEVQKKSCEIKAITLEDEFQKAIVDLNRLINKSTRTMQKRYSEKDTGSCFSIIDVHLNNKKIVEYICFSGMFDSMDAKIQKNFDTKKGNGLNKAIDDILKSPEFAHAKLVNTNANVRYYYDSSSNYITLMDLCNAIKSGYKHLHRMFSCCERKFYTALINYDISEVDKYKIFSKYNPCSMCERAISDFRSLGYIDQIMFGVKKDFGADFTHYDKLAKDISSGTKGIDYKA